MRHSFLLTAGTIASQVIPLLFTLLLSRFYSNESFGIYHLFYQITVVLGVVANGRLEQVVLTAKDDKESKAAAQTAIKISFYFSVVLLLVALLCLQAKWAPGFVGSLGIWLWILPASVFLNAHTLLLSYQINRRKKYRQIVVSKILLVTLASLIPVASIVVQAYHSAALLIMGYLAGLLVSTWYLMVQAGIGVPKAFAFNAADKVVVKKHRSFLLYSAPAILVDQLAAAMPLLFIASFYGAGAAGNFSFAQRILIVPSVFIAASVAQVFIRQATDQYHGRQNLFAFTLKAFFALLAMGVLPFGLLIIFGEQLFTFIFGSQWLDAGKFAAMLAWAMILKFAVSPISGAMVVTNSIRLQSLWQLTALAANGILVYYASNHLNISQFIFGLTMLDIGLYLFYLAMILHSTKATIRN